MILVILAIGIILVVASLLIFYKTYAEAAGCACMVIGGIIIIISIIVIVGLLVTLSQLAVIQNKIDMYNEENVKIESQIDSIVKTYMEHENEIFENITPSDSMSIVFLYPELKSDTLVQKQLETYMSNNKKIKELKEEQIDGSIIKWWLYFGH